MLIHLITEMLQFQTLSRRKRSQQAQWLGKRAIKGNAGINPEMNGGTGGNSQDKQH